MVITPARSLCQQKSTRIFDIFVKAIRKRENDVQDDLDQLRTKKLLLVEAQKSRIINIITASTTATSYLNSHQTDPTYLKCMEDVADRGTRHLQEDGDPCASVKLVFTSNTIEIWWM